MQTARLSFSLLIALSLLAGGSSGCTKQARKNRYLSRAAHDFETERYDRAEVEYLGVLRIAPTEPVAMTRLGLIYYAEGKLPQACAYLQKGLELHAENLDARAKLGQTLFSLRSFNEAREEAGRILDKQPGNEDALLLLAGTAFTTNQLQETLRRFEALPPAVRATAAYHVARSSISFLELDQGQAELELRQAIALDPKSSTAYMGLGDLYLARGAVKEAEAALKMAADLAPLRSPVRLRYADFRLRNGAVDAARDMVQEITKKAPDYVPAWVFLAQLAFAQQRYPDCDSLLKMTLLRDPINLDALMLKGGLLLAQGDTTNAITQFQRILGIGIYKRVPQVEYRLAFAQVQAGAAAAAAQILSQTLAHEPDFADAILLLANLKIRTGESASAVVSLRKLIQQQPQIPQAHLLLASAYLAQKNPDEAAAVYRRMEELFPKSPEVPQLLGIVLAQQKNRAEARKAFEKSLEISPAYLPALENLVDLDLLEKQYAAAKERVQKQMEKDPSAAGPWLLIAKIAMTEAMGYNPEEPAGAAVSTRAKLQFSDNPAARGELDRAESALVRAISLDPNLSTSYLLLARLYLATNKHQQALDRLNAFLSKTNNVAALMQLGMIQDEMKHYEAAKDAYEKLLVVNPRFSPALNNLAYLYSERFQQLGKAYQMAEKARQLLPYDPSTADTLGWILYKRGEYSRALGMLEESAEKLPGEPEVRFHLGMTHYMLGEEDAARAQLEIGVQSTKEFSGKDEGRRCLEILALDVRTAGAVEVNRLEKRLQEAPNDPVAFSRLGAIQERDRAFAKAAETYQQGLKKNPQNPQFMLHLARLYSHQLKRPAEALELAKAAHSLAPEDAQVTRTLGQLVYRARDYTWAASLLEEAARKLPADPEISHDLAWAYYSLGRIAEAQASMQAAVQAGPPSAFTDDGKRFLTMVAACGEAVQAEALAAEARRVLAQDPNYAPALMISAASEEKQGSYLEAARVYERVLAQYPAFVPALKNLAQLYFEHLGDDQKAFELGAEARRASPKDPDIAKTLGLLAFRRGDFGRSAQLLDESARQRTTDAELQYYLGMAFYRLKDGARSKVALERALNLNVRAQLADEATRAIKELQ
jgi:tetratricopeptide (TPR) repeat protein